MSTLNGKSFSNPKNINLTQGILRFGATNSSNPLSSTSNGLYVNSSNQLVFTSQGSTTVIGAAGAGAIPNWENIYAQDVTFTVSSGTFTIGGNHADATDVLTLTNIAGGSGDVLQITNSGTGNDIQGTSNTWKVTKAGVATFAGVSISGTSSALTTTGAAVWTLLDNSATALSIGSAGLTDLLVLDTTDNAGVVTVGSGGGLTVTQGATILTQASNTVSALVVTDNTVTTFGADANSAGVVVLRSTSLTTGSLLQLQLTEGTLNGGFYLTCRDVTAGSNRFTVGEDGATVIGGAAVGTSALTLTAGDITVSDGNVAITSSSTADVVSITDDSLLANNALIVKGSGTFTGSTTGSFVAITPTGMTTGTALYVAGAAATTLSTLVDFTTSTTTGTALRLTTTGTQTGVGSALEIIADSATTPGASAGEGIVKVSADGLTTGTALDVTSTSIVLTTGRIADFSHISGNITGTLNKSGDFFNLSSFRTVTTGTVADDYDMANLIRTSVINGGGSFSATGSVLRIENAVTNSSGTVTDTVKGLEVVMDSLGTGDAVEITHAATGGIALNVIGAATSVDDVLIATTGVKADNKAALQVTNSGATAAGGSVLRVVNTGTPAAATSYLVDFDYSGATMTNNPTTVYVNGKDSTNSTLEINSSGASAASKGMVSLLNSNTGAVGVVIHTQHTSTGSAANNDAVLTIKAEGLDSGDAVTEYCRLEAEIQVVTAGQEDGRFVLSCAANDGTLTQMATLNPRAGGALSELVMGSGAGNAYITTSGAYDLILDTNQGTNSGNITIADAANGNITITPNGTGKVDLATAVTFSATETIAAGGTSTAMSLAKVVHYIDADAGGDTFTLADGVDGQIAVVMLTSSTGTATVTPANLAGGTSITLNADGDSVILMFMDTEWFVLGGNSYSVA